MDMYSTIRERTPFLWMEIHPDNDTAFLNWHLYHYTQKEKSRFFETQDLTVRTLLKLLDL